MTVKQAKEVGGKLGLLSAVYGLVIAELIMAVFTVGDVGLIKGLFWFLDFNYKLNLLIGIIILLSSCYLYGRIAGKLILIHKCHPVLTGILCGITVLFTTGILSGWLGFFQEGIDNSASYDDPFEDYIMKPFLNIMIFGFIPVLFVGASMGRRIKKRGNKQVSI